MQPSASRLTFSPVFPSLTDSMLSLLELTAAAGKWRAGGGVRESVAHVVGNRGIGFRRDHEDGQPEVLETMG